MGDGAGFFKGFFVRMRLLAGLAGLIIALVPPATYFSLNLEEQRVRANYLGDEVARRILPTVKANPELWKYSVVKFAQVFDEIEAREIVDIRILDSEGAILGDMKYEARPILKVTGGSDIFYNNANYGRVELSKAADSTLYTTALLVLGFSLLGALVGFTLLHYPSVIVRKAEKDIDETIGRLNAEVLERGRREEELSASLLEKEVLLREVHHRVKNNLQIISSLVNLQIQSPREGVSPEEMLEGIKHRVNTMALVHECLYESPSLSLVDMDGYLRSLALSYVDAASGGPTVFRYEVHAPGISLPLESAMPIGLIVCELVINSLKYAFPGRDSGFIQIALRRRDEGGLRLDVSDDGVGAAPGGDRAGLGFKIVRALVSQLRGKLSLESSGGFRVTIDGIAAEPDR
jgi:two-component sensor histidine kinase